MVEGASIVPSRAQLRLQLVQFSDLHHCHAPIDHVSGFDLSLFGGETRGIATVDVTEQVWQYPFTPLCDPATLLTFSFKELVHDVNGELS